MSQHAKYRPPSAASRWLSCSASASLLTLYPNLPSDASIKGDEGHFMLETALEWGIVPDHSDIELVYMVQMAVDHVTAKKASLGPKCELHVETTLDIPETGEIGTADLIYVTPTLLDIEDFKSGYVPVDVNKNAQCMTYLLGAIAKFGERPNYRIGVIQPAYSHRDGMIRHYDVSHEEVEWFRREVMTSMTTDTFTAGKHCRTTYCPHRGACAAFLAYAQEHLADAWWPGEIGGLSDDELGYALDHADILQGYRDQLRGEVLRRIVNQGRQITGYKVVRGRITRDYASDEARDKIFNALREIGASEDELYEKVPISIAGVDRVLKRIYKNFGRGAWLEAKERIVNDAMLETKNQPLTVEKDIDGRKPYKRGSEFTPLTLPNEVPKLPDLLADEQTNGLSIL